LIPPGVAGPGIGNAPVGAAVSGVLQPAVDVVAAGVVEPEVVSVVLVAAACIPAAPVAELSAFFDIAFAAAVVPAALADVAEPPGSSDIVPAFDVSAPAAVFAAGPYSSGRPRFFAFPNIDFFPSFSSYCEAARKESVHGPSGVRANDGLCSTLSSPGLYHNKNTEQRYSMPNPDHNNTSDTNDLPMDATTSHSRKKCRRLYQEQRTRRMHQAPRSPPEEPGKQSAAEEEIRYLYLPLPLQRLARQAPMPKEWTLRAISSFCCLL